MVGWDWTDGVLHFENLLKSYAHLGFQCDVLGVMDAPEGTPASKALCNSSFNLRVRNSEAPICSASTVLLDFLWGILPGSRILWDIFDISLWLTCGGLGSTNFGVFLIMKTHAVWAPSGQMAPHHHSGAVDLPMDMRWMALNAQVTWCGLKETGNLILCWIPPQRTRSFWITTSFAPWAWNTSMICTRVSNLCPQGSTVFVWLKGRRAPIWPAHYQRRGIAYRAWRSSRTSGQPWSTGSRPNKSLGRGYPAGSPWGGSWAYQGWVIFFWRCRARSKLRRSSIHLVLIGDSPVREKRWDNDQGVTNKHKKQDSKPQHKQPNNQNQKGHLGSKVKHYAFRKVPMPLSTAPRWCSKYHS